MQRDGVTFTLVEKDCLYQVVYEVKDTEISVKLTATPRKPLPISLTNHSFFCLGEENIDNLLLQIKSHKILDCRKEDLIAVGETEIVPCLDFNELTKINHDIDNPIIKNHRSNGIDHFFIKDDDSSVILESPKYRLVIDSDFETVVVYSYNYPDGVEMINTKQETRKGVAIEPSDSVLKRKLYSQPYKRFIKYSFYKK